MGGHTEDRYFLINGKKPSKYYLDSIAIEQKIKSITIINEYDKFEIETKLFRIRFQDYPIFTVSGSEAGLEKVYQSSVIIPNWKINLMPNGSRENKI